MKNEIISKIETLVDTAEKFKSAYFWNPPCSASSRRSYEKKFSIPEFSWEENGHTYTAEYNVSCSCKNVYASGTYYKDGKKTTLTAIKNSLKRLSA